jgi:N-acetylmuramoyl-L-alanine amidase
MAGWKEIVDKSFTPDAFDSYCHTLQWTAWRPSFIVLHNTAIPSLAQRPNGITNQHIQNFVSFYRDVQGWNSGPHLFVDDKQIWVFTPLIVSGTHSPSWNKVSLGVEMLGDYEHEAFDAGRGLQVRKNAVAALATLSAILGIDSLTMRLHREDPLTTHACPGKNVRKTDVIQEVQDLMVARHPGEHLIQPDAAPEAPGTPAP